MSETDWMKEVRLIQGKHTVYRPMKDEKGAIRIQICIQGEGHPQMDPARWKTIQHWNSDELAVPTIADEDRARLLAIRSAITDMVGYD